MPKVVAVGASQVLRRLPMTRILDRLAIGRGLLQVTQTDNAPESCCVDMGARPRRQPASDPENRQRTRIPNKFNGHCATTG